MADTIHDKGGNDLIDGGGDGCICAGNGTNTAAGAKGNDHFSTGMDADTVTGKLAKKAV
jgi:hypothetical protein